MFVFFILFAALLVWPVINPRIDVIASGLFYRANEGGFFLADNVLCVTLHWLAYDGARVLGVVFALAAVAGYIRRKPFGGIDGKAGLFLLVALLIGPVLIANVGLKDHWGRARPREVTEFGGTAKFTPVLEPHFERGHSNGSFVSGDGAFGFFLPTLAYIAPRPRSRRVFWGGMIAGCAFGLARIIMGAHFFSDVIYAAATMLASSAAVHAAMYGRGETKARWRLWFGR